MSNYLKALVSDELDACTQAITDYIRSPMDFADELGITGSGASTRR